VIEVGEWMTATNELVDDDGYTTVELAKAMGCSPATMHRKLRRGLEQGTVRKGLARRPTRLGNMVLVPVYQLAKEGK
jgi:hypothetical protein